MHALDNLTIARFRGLRDLSLAGLGRVNLLVGKNNSGKTSVLEAISLYCNPLDEFAWIHTAQRRELGDSRLSLSESIAWLFPRKQSDDPRELPQVRIEGPRGVLTATYRPIEATGDHLALSQFKRLHRLRSAAVLKGAELDITRTGSDEDSLEELFRLWDELPVTREQIEPRRAIPVDIVTPMSHRLEGAQVQHLTQATIANFKDDVLALLRHLDPQILDLDVLDPEGGASSVYVHHKTVGHAPLSTVGSGLQRALLYSLTIPNVRGGVLLIDELESAIHVSALPEIFTWLVQACEQHDIQLFATTHSLEAVDAVLGASEQHLDRIVGFRLNPPGSHASVTRFDGELLHGIRHERGLDVR